MKAKHMILSGLGVFVLWLFFWPSEKDHLNAQMAELCKKDGGVKIYETVKLPAEMFDQFGQPKFEKNNVLKMPKNMQAHRLGSSYTYIIETTVLKEGDPWKNQGYLSKDQFRIQRNVDKKIMAEEIQYYRSGGDRWYPGHPSASSCPLGAGNITEKVFIKDSNFNLQGLAK